MNYSRFYALFRLLPKYGDDEQQKEQLVLQISHGRTPSLRELSAHEYTHLCNLLDEKVGQRELLRKRRSAVLQQMTRMGIDTSDWANVDRFCQQPRIARKPFRYLDIEELAALSRKLRAIERKSQPPRITIMQPKPPTHIFAIPDNTTFKHLPS